MASPTTVLASTPIAELNPSLRPDESSVTGIVTLIWPYASSKSTLSLLLVEPDFRLRSNRGQVRVHFQNSSAKAVARSGINSGDQLLLSLKGAQWAKDSTAAVTPGRGIDWQLQYGERLMLQIQRPSQSPISLDIDHPTPSPEPPDQTSTPALSPPHKNLYASTTGRPQLNAQAWASPAFLKRSHILATDYDPFAEEEFPDNDRRKRTKFGRGSGQWRFAERTPSPEKEPETLPFEVSSPSRLPAQDGLREDEFQTRNQQAYGTRSTLEASSVVTNALIDRSELEIQSKVGLAAEDTSVGEDREPATSLSQVDGTKRMLHEIAQDEIIGGTTVTTSRSPQMKNGSNEVDGPEGREEVDGSTTGHASSTSMIGYVGGGITHEAAQSAQASPSAPIEVLSSASSSSKLESDQYSDGNLNQDSDDVSQHEYDSLFDEQSDSGQSNVAMYSDPASDLGLDGSTFSRPPPSAEFATPPSVIKRLEEGLETNVLNIDDATDNSSHIQSSVEQIESEIDEPLIFKGSATDSLLREAEESGADIDVLEGHDAAQRRSSIEMPSSDQLGSPDTSELDDEVMKDPAAMQSFISDGYPWEMVEMIQNESAMQPFSSTPSSFLNHSESRESQEELEHEAQKIAKNEAALTLIPEKSPPDPPERRSPSSSQEKFDFSAALDKSDTLETSPEKASIDSSVRQESLVTRQQEAVLDTTLIREDSRAVTSLGQEFRDSEHLDMGTSEIEQTIIETIDSESGDEDSITSQNVGLNGLQMLVDENDSESAPTYRVSANATPLLLASDAGKEHRILVDGTSRVPTLSDSMGAVLEPITGGDESPPTDTREGPEAHEEAFKFGQKISRNQPPKSRTEEYQDQSPLVEAQPLRSQEASFKSKERELPSAEKPRLEQPATVETELMPIPTDELPSTVPDSFEGMTLKSQLLTPSSTQQPNDVSQSSSVSLHSTPEENTLPTPRLTQATSAEIAPPQPFVPPEEPAPTETPAPPPKTSALIERLKAMRRLSSQSPKPRSSDAGVLDPYFAPSQLSQIVPDSEDGSEAERSPEREALAKIPKVVGRQLPQTPEKTLAKTFIRSPSQPKHISSIQSSPQYLPPSQPPPPGFRTTLSYFVPLATLPSHFATTVDVLAIALSSAPVTRATSGAKDYNQTLYITDPSSLASQHSVTTAQIFRPNNRCFPLVEKGEALLLRDFKVQPFQQRLLLLSTESSAWAVFRKGADVQMRGPPVEFGAEERGFARGLWDWWASLGDDARKGLEDAVPEHKKPNGAAKTAKAKAAGKKSDVPIKKDEIEGLGIDLPGSQSKKRESTKERSLALDGVEEKDMVHESVEAPRRVLRARGAKGMNGRSESARESRFGTVFTGGLGEPDETQGSAHELRDGKAYRARKR